MIPSNYTLLPKMHLQSFLLQMGWVGFIKELHAIVAHLFDSNSSSPDRHSFCGSIDGSFCDGGYWWTFDVGFVRFNKSGCCVLFLSFMP